MIESLWSRSTSKLARHGMGYGRIMEILIPLQGHTSTWGTRVFVWLDISRFFVIFLDRKFLFGVYVKEDLCALPPYSCWFLCLHYRVWNGELQYSVFTYYSSQQGRKVFIFHVHEETEIAISSVIFICLAKWANISVVFSSRTSANLFSAG